MASLRDVLGTPGPWRIRRLAEGRGYRILGGERGKTVVAEVPDGHAADAFLVAAAPDLLAAALRVSMGLETRQVEGMEAACQALEEALAQALPMLVKQRAEGLPKE